MVDIGGLGLLGRHVLGGAERTRGVRAHLPDRRGDAEVGEVHAIALDEDVAGLHVAVDQPAFVGVIERRGHRSEERSDPSG